MTIEEALIMIQAKKKCIESDTSGKGELCNRECDDCVLNYMQGNMGEQKEWLGMAIEALKFQKEYQTKMQRCISRINEAIEDTFYKSVSGSYASGIKNSCYHECRKILEKELGCAGRLE